MCVCVHVREHQSLLDNKLTLPDVHICMKSALLAALSTSKFQTSGGLKFGTGTPGSLRRCLFLLVFIPGLGVGVDAALVVPLVHGAL